MTTGLAAGEGDAAGPAIGEATGLAAGEATGDAAGEATGLATEDATGLAAGDAAAAGFATVAVGDGWGAGLQPASSVGRMTAA
jgi:hypothetical protein